MLLDKSTRKKVEMLRSILSEVAISGELRGWEYDKPPVKPPRQILIPVSELASRYCPTMRDIFLKRVLKRPPPTSFKTFRGIVYHSLITRTLIEAKKMIYGLGLISGSEFYERMLANLHSIVDDALADGLKKCGVVSENEVDEVRRKSLGLCKYLLIEAAYSINQTLSRFPHINIDSLVSEAIPPITEMKIDGSLVGLSRELSSDVYIPAGAVIDIKTGEVREFHRYSAAGYALAIEADKGIPIDIGIIIYISLESGEVPKLIYDTFIVGDELRREFLEIRDEAQLVVERGVDPGRPPTCPNYCPYYPYCSGGV